MSTRALGAEALHGLSVHQDVDMRTTEDMAYKRLDGTPVTVGQVAEAQARLLDLIYRRAKQWEKSGNPARRASAAELLEVLGR